MGVTHKEGVGFTVDSDNVVDFTASIKTDTLNEHTSGSGITLDTLLIKDGFIYLKNYTPASAGATGTLGMVCRDVSYIYVCTATDTWERVAIASW